jgi:hypothetical protein
MERAMERHISIVGGLHIAYNCIGLLVGLSLFMVLTGIGVFTGDDVAFTALALVGTFLVGLFLIGTIPGIIGGIFLLQRREWARILVIILSFFDLLHVPIGTCLGAYSIYVLLNPEVIAAFQPRSTSPVAAPVAPPPSAV